MKRRRVGEAKVGDYIYYRDANLYYSECPAVVVDIVDGRISYVMYNHNTGSMFYGTRHEKEAVWLYHYFSDDPPTPEK